MRDASGLLQDNRQLFVWTRNIRCFGGCERQKAQWAATGYSRVHGPWAICVDCKMERGEKGVKS